MTCSGGAIRCVVDHVAVVGGGRAARSWAARWAVVEPVLAGFGSPAGAAAACRAARPAEHDVLVSALLRLAGEGDEWAQPTVVAGLADRMAWVVARWRRAGMPPGVLADAEAELVAVCWAAIAACGDGGPPDRPGLALVDRAWETVRAGRRRQRRRDDRRVALPAEAPAAVVRSADVLVVGVSPSCPRGRGLSSGLCASGALSVLQGESRLASGVFAGGPP